MSKIVTSASKIVFILITITACVGFIMKIMEAKDFMLLASMAFSFYFANKGDNTKEVTTTTSGTTETKSVVNELPYLGK